MHDDILDFNGGSNRKCLLIGLGITGAVVVIVAITLGVVFGGQFKPYQLPATSAGQLVLLERTDVKRDNGDNPVVARSYDGNPWETVADQDFDPVTIDCSGSCKVTTKGTYQVREISVPEELKGATEQEKFARFLSQATFGFRKSELQSAVSAFPNGNYLQWILDQMAKPATLLRTYYRLRTNPRQEASTEVGTLYLPCEPGSRWHMYAFNTEDKGSVVTIEISGGLFTFKIAGILRAEVATFQNGTTANSTFTFPLTLTICDVGESLGSTIKFASQANLSACTILMPNPAIQLTTSGASFLDLSTGATFSPLLSRTDVLILNTISGSVSCNLGTRDSFIKYNSNFYRYDPRLKLLLNTLESPIDTNAVASLKCPAVVKTFLNNATCVRRAGCAPLTFSPALVQLNDTMIRSWYLDSTRYVYYVTGLRLEAPFFTSPCSGISRWRRVGPVPCPAKTTTLDAMTLTTLSNALANSTDANPYVRDITLNGRNCTSNNTAAIGAQLEVNGECFQHVHPDLYSVRDFTYWTLFHDGNVDALTANHPNPIAKWAEQGGTNLPFPSWHPMQRFYDKKYAIPAIGRYGDSVEFRTLPTELQTVPMAQRVNAIATRSSDGYEVCGSPGEVANDPTLGHRYQLPDLSPTDTRNRELDYKHPFNSGKSMLWTNVIMTANDQLRQRVSWALSQIFTMANAGIDGRDADNEPWVTYYDIFVRNAFGNYRDIMREVSYSPFMSLYLSYYQNKAFAFANTYPDENYAREIMQLFSVGLWKLNEDGSQVFDSNGIPLPTYTNDDIIDFARLWTGFDSQQPRSNIEQQGGTGSMNVMDPLQIKPGWRDLLPKAKLDSGFLGDLYPLCDNLPPQHWTKAGARFVFTGGNSIEGKTMDAEAPNDVGYRGRLNLATTSTLYQLLCKPDGTGKCTFPSDVTLSQNIPCDGEECTATRVLAVKVVDPVANATKYFSYYSVPCVRLTFFDQGKLTVSGGNKQCTHPNHTVGAPVCCANATPTRAVSNLTNICTFSNEVMNFQTATDRCKAAGLGLCNVNYTGTSTWFTSCASGVFQWVNANCSLKVQVYLSGQIGIYDPAAPASFKILAKSSGNVFRVRWTDGNFPAAKNGCGSGCSVLTTPSGDTCVCDIQVAERAVFTDSSRVPSVSQLTSSLFVGGANPASFGDYVKCTSSACAGNSDVTVWTKSSSNGEWDASTIFEIPPSHAGGPKRYLLNFESVVHVDSFSFRNPPHFMPLAGEQTFTFQQWTSDSLWLQRATQEVEDLLDHLFEHQSTAPFVAYRMIQRMVTSNPSQRYMKSVVKAFKTGAYNGQVFSGKYGDIAATVAAVLLDREARSTTLEADPNFGVLREPLLKVIHVLRAMEYKSRGAEIMLPNIVSRIGMEPFYSPTVFGFYLPENRPDGPITEAGLVSPEAQLGVSPLVIGYLNGMVSLVDNGLSPCALGFGFSDGRSCSGANANATADGWFQYTPASTDPSSIIDELDLLLTNGRLNADNRDYIIQRYTSAVGNTSASAASALRLAQKLVISTPEFHTTQANILKNKTRTKTTATKSLGRPYKAIVVIFMAGGCDSYNLVVPYANCSAKDLYAEYSTVRGLATVDKANLLPINVPAGTQPCSTFGINDAMPNLKALYDAGDAMFLSSIGALVEPLTKGDYFKTSGKVKRFPPSLFAHNIMTRSMHNLDPQNTASKGVLGRAVTALEEQAAPYKSDLFSLIGTVKMLEGTHGIDYIDPYGGVTKFQQYNQFATAFGNFTEFEAESHFSETYARLLKASIEKTEALSGQLTNTTLNTTFGTDYVSVQLRQVAKLIKMRDYLQTERAVFVTQRGGYDTHNTVNMQALFGDVDKGLGSFVAEMKAQGIWDNIAVLTVSEFGRTLTTNGAGTDHAWAGNHFLAGGKLRGGKILGKYPDTLTDDGISSIGRGRLLPTTSWDAVWKGLVQWFGVQDSQLPYVLPNLHNFPSSDVFSVADLFEN